jgi:ABC-type glutathione transport system ATPase component
MNTQLPAGALDDAFRKLTRPEGPTLEARNRALHRLLVGERCCALTRARGRRDGRPSTPAITRSRAPDHRGVPHDALGNQLRMLASRGELDAEARRYLELFGLGGFERHHPWEFSRGMQQRVAIARALARQPDVLLMDEPFGSLDALTRIELEDTLLSLRSALRTTILFVTHDIEEAVYLSDRVHLLSRRPARVIEEIEVQLERPRHQLTTRDAAARPRFRRARRLRSLRSPRCCQRGRRPQSPARRRRPGRVGHIADIAGFR